MKSIIEYGHYYKKQGPSSSTKKSIDFFKKLNEKGYFGKDIFEVLFIDDVHEIDPQDSTSSDVIVKNEMFDKIFLESRMKVSALQLIKELEDKIPDNINIDGLDKYLQDGGKTKIKLQSGKTPSCVVLDLVCVLQKNSGKTGKGNKELFTILPLSYKKQQLYVHDMLMYLFKIGHIKSNINYNSILFNDDLSSYTNINTSLSLKKITSNTV